MILAPQTLTHPQFVTRILRMLIVVLEGFLLCDVLSYTMSSRSQNEHTSHNEWCNGIHSQTHFTSALQQTIGIVGGTNISVDELTTLFEGHTRITQRFSAQWMLLLIMYTCMYHDVEVRNNIGIAFVHCVSLCIVIHTMPHSEQGRIQDFVPEGVSWHNVPDK